MPSPIGITGCVTDIPGNNPATHTGPPNAIASITPTVLANFIPVLTVGAIAAPHGNYQFPDKPGYNPLCASAKVLTPTSPNILIEGKPAAGLGSLLTCGHFVAGTGAPTVIVGP
jgi:uncharacterized Zn-binding protein involved in type VI secretion